VVTSSDICTQLLLVLSLIFIELIDFNLHVHTFSNGNGKVESNPFDEEEEWDEADNVLVDNGEPGVPVKALYDYDGAESDELTFKQGTLITIVYYVCQMNLLIILIFSVCIR